MSTTMHTEGRYMAGKRNSIMASFLYEQSSTIETMIDEGTNIRPVCNNTYCDCLTIESIKMANEAKKIIGMITLAFYCTSCRI